ncbi:unnamed protein product [Brassica napus]|uniref:(rape) hypothetical protein n=1 Tax=Brassica napus TaxID=3708 RepID=A0A816ZDP8_BRANA|nr:unnamed protein product [Brassica napus]
MEGKVFLRKYLIWVILLLGQLHGYKSCVEKERKALLDLKQYLISVSVEGQSDYVLPTWTNDTKSHCCWWEGVKCNSTSGRVTKIAYSDLHLKESCFFNLSLLHPFEDVRSLDLSFNSFSGLFDDVEGYKSLGRLRNLEILDFSFNSFNNSIFPFLDAATSLTTLSLSGNSFNGPFPDKELTDLTNLQVLDLSANRFNGSLSMIMFLGKAIFLCVILSCGSFTCPEEAESSGSKLICEMKNMQELNLRGNKLLGQFPLCLTVLTGLQYLDLSANQLTGRVPSSLGNLGSLKHLSLLDNNFEGLFSFGLLANLSELRVFKIGSKSKSFQVDSINNAFNHMLPEDIGWVLPHLLYINLANNGFHGYLPSSLGNMKELSYLDLSHNSFHGKLPRSFVMGCYSMEILTLSHNKLSGEVFPESVNFTRIRKLSMDNNLFTGKVGQGLRNFKYLSLLDISNNNLTGVIPSWIGEFTYLYELQLSDNSLEGEIPISLFNLTDLLLLDLSANLLTGGIPPHVNSERTVVLLLQDNKLSGVIPNTLLTNVSVLDLRNNRLSGNIPAFTNTQDTHTLLLRGNNLTGSIPRQLCGLRNLKLFDLANNRLNGSIPSCFSNTSFVLRKKDTLVDRNQIKIEFATKHRYDAYLGGNLNLLFGMDLSGNELSGDIPAELGGLVELQALNLSHNELSGSIPESFSGLKNVESLDLSFNRLQGRIPSQLTELCSLAVFDVSFNNLSGVIPQGKQFNTFGTQSYLGNYLLCGKPTNTSCGSSNFQEPDNEAEAEESTVDMVSFYWSLAAAYVTILLGLFTSLSFDSPWSRFWFYLVDAFIHKAKNLLR